MAAFYSRNFGLAAGAIVKGENVLIQGESEEHRALSLGAGEKQHQEHSEESLCHTRRCNLSRGLLCGGFFA
jgi:hypothetical protein